METDHFRPWRKPFGPNNERRFEHLRDDPKNLVHSCGICNRFKSDHWPTEDPSLPFDGEKGWIEPFIENRLNFFEVDGDGTVNALKPPAEYQIRILRLNRPLLKRLREKAILEAEFRAYAARCRPQWERIVADEVGTPHATTARQALHALDLAEAALSGMK
jgi:hypothetical protein